MRASKPSRLERCGRRCDWPAGQPVVGDDGPRQRRAKLRAGLMLPPRSDVTVSLSALLRTRCESARRLLLQSQCVQVLVLVVPRRPALN